MLTALAVVKSPAKEALDAGGVSAQSLNEAINDLRKGRTADTASAEDTYEALEKYAQDLTARASEGKIDPIIGRDDEIRRAMQVLSRRTKNNPVLIGEPGVGKTAIAEGLACASSTAMCRNPCATSGCWRSTWARSSPGRNIAASSRSGSRACSTR